MFLPVNTAESKAKKQIHVYWSSSSHGVFELTG